APVCDHSFALRLCLFFFKAEDGIRDRNVTGVQTCALPILKKAALREHKNLLAEYTDWRVILGYGLFVGCTLLTMLAYRGVPLNVGPVLEATGYLYVTVFGVTIFHERMNGKKAAALALILLGIAVYAL